MFLTQLVFVCLFSDIDYQSYDGNHKFFKKNTFDSVILLSLLFLEPDPLGCSKSL